MKSKLVVWIALMAFLLIGILANVIFTSMYYSRSQDRLERCITLARDTGAESNSCFQISSAADSSYSSLASLNDITFFLACMGLLILSDRLFSNEKRLDKLEKTLNV